MTTKKHSGQSKLSDFLPKDERKEQKARVKKGNDYYKKWHTPLTEEEKIENLERIE